MKGMSRTISTLALALMALAAVSAADAANLMARSPVISPANGYPSWYQDNNGLALSLCLDQNGFCVPPPIAFIAPATRAGINATNFPNESFYYMADTSGVSPGGTISLTLYEAALEASFAAAVVDGGQAVFSRIRIRAEVTLPGTYTVTHPYGVNTFVVAAADIGPRLEINFTEDVPGLVAGAFDASLTSRVGPFLTRADGTFVTDPISGSRYISTPGVPVTVTGGIGGVNSVTITGPTADTLILNTFSLAGKTIGMEVLPGKTFNLGANNIASLVGVPQTVTINNLTGAPITFGDLNLIAANAKGGADAADFIITSPSAGVPVAGVVGCSNATLTTVAPGSNKCSFDITFRPTTTTAAVPPVAAHAARVATITLAPTSTVAPPPPVILTLSGTAQVTVNASVAASGHGTVTPLTQTVNAATPVTFTLAPTNRKFKVKELIDVAGVLPGVTVAAPFTFNAGDVNHVVTATFMPSGDLDMDGAVTVSDALRALKLVVGVPVVPAQVLPEDNAAMILAPLEGGIPTPVARTLPNLGDVLVILRRAVGLETW